MYHTGKYKKARLITGGAGFIGSAYLRRWVPQHPDTLFICLDKLTYAGNLENLAPVIPADNFFFVKGSVSNAELIETLFEAYTIESIVNFAAESHVDRSIDGPSIFLETNTAGTQVLLEAARKYSIRFLQVSTDEVYGDLSRTEPAFTEQHPIKASSPYSASKAAADLLVLAYHRTFKLDVVITRCSNNYGPYQFPEKLIPVMIRKAIKQESLPVYGDGKNIRDWIYVDDHADGIEVALQKGKSGEAYNFGGDSELENIVVVKKILAAVDRPESLISFVTDRPGHDRRYAINFSKAKSELGWTPHHSFDEALAETVSWYQNNSTWMDAIESGAYRKYTINQFK